MLRLSKSASVATVFRSKIGRPRVQQIIKTEIGKTVLDGVALSLAEPAAALETSRVDHLPPTDGDLVAADFVRADKAPGIIMIVVC